MPKQSMQMGDLVNEVRSALIESGTCVSEEISIHASLDLNPAPLWLPAIKDNESMELDLLKLLMGPEFSKCMRLQTDEHISIILEWSQQHSFTKAFYICQLKMDMGLSVGGQPGESLMHEGIVGLQELLQQTPCKFMDAVAVRLQPQPDPRLCP